MTQFLIGMIPDQLSRWLLLIGGALGTVASFLFGDLSDSILWLVVFIISDYITGTVAALKTGVWNSRSGFLGITKKILIVALVALCHGLDVSSVIPFLSLRDVAVFAFCLNDFGSILENIERLGYGALIPVPVRKALLALREKAEAGGSIFDHTEEK